MKILNKLSYITALFICIFVTVEVLAMEKLNHHDKAMKSDKNKYIYLLRDGYIGFKYREKKEYLYKSGIVFKVPFLAKYISIPGVAKSAKRLKLPRYISYYTDVNYVRKFNKRFKRMLEREFKITGLTKKYRFFQRVDLLKIKATPWRDLRRTSVEGFYDFSENHDFLQEEVFNIVDSTIKQYVALMQKTIVGKKSIEKKIKVDLTQAKTTKEKIQLILKTYYPFEGIGYINPKLGKKWFDQKKTFLTPEDIKELMTYKDDPDTYFQVHNLD